MSEKDEVSYSVPNMPRLRLNMPQTGDSIVIEREETSAEVDSRSPTEAHASLSDLVRSSLDRLHLFDKMNSKLDLEGIRTMCLILKIDYEELSGENKRGKIREMWRFAEREERMAEFMTILQKWEII